MDCFVAGIVKGIKERNDATVHFGSLMGFLDHMNNAIRCGLVDPHLPSDKLYHYKLTKKGKRYYKDKGLADFPNCRSYMWSLTHPNADYSVEAS